MKNNTKKRLRIYEGNNKYTFVNCTIGAAFRFWLMTVLSGKEVTGVSDNEQTLLRRSHERSSKKQS